MTASVPKPFLCLVCVLLGSLPLAAEPEAPPPPLAEDPALLHQTAMKNLEMISKKWEKLAEESRKRDQKDLFHRLSESYADYKAIREEAYQAEQNRHPVSYEKLIQQRARILGMEKEAEVHLGKGTPRLPPEPRPRVPEAASAVPTPLPPTHYTTESGFRVQLRLED